MKQIVSLSGGKDSTAMLLMMLERREQIDNIVFFDWGMEFPQMYEHLEKLETYIGRTITRLYPKYSYEFYLVDYELKKGKRKGEHGYGWPKRMVPWCSRIKYQSFQRLYKDTTQCIGYAYEERFRRAADRNGYRYPLLEWGVSETAALKYCLSNGFDWGGLYSIFKRVSCWHCPNQGSAIRKLRDNFPELWQRLLEMDAKSPYPWPNNDLERIQQEITEH